MAEDVDHALTFLLRSLRNKSMQFYRLARGAGSERRLLEGELNSMTAFLRELGEQPERGELLKQNERELREAIHEGWYLFNECRTRSELQNPFIPKFCYPKYMSAAYKVKSFRQKTILLLSDKYSRIAASYDHIALPAAENIIGPQGEASSSTQYGNEEIQLEIIHVPEETIIGPQGEASSISTNHQTSPRRGTVVGFDEKADTVIPLIISNGESGQLVVICIPAMPGQGKTTLARTICKDTRITRQFPRPIWVDVSKYEKRKVFLSILKEFTDEDTSSYSDDYLASIIKIMLKRVEFLLVLDDVRDPEHWIDIEAALPKDNELGRVLITSRIECVGVRANCTRIYRLENLDCAKSWELLQLQVYDNLDLCPPDLIGFGEKIANGCGGVPLAIVVMGAILSKINSTSQENERRDQWEKVSTSVMKHLYQEDEGRLSKIIEWSFRKLSYHLKECFLYMAMFPQGCQIPVKILLDRWIAEGFIESLEVAHANLRGLVDMNLVMAVDRKPDGYIKTVRVHDLIHAFCKTEASHGNYNLFQEIEMSSAGIFVPPVSEIHKFHRICIHSDLIDGFIKRNPKGPRVSTFCIFPKDAVSSLPSDTSLFPPNYERLTVLDWRSIKLTRFPPELTHQIHLRHIALSADGDHFTVPKGICRLWNLKSLIIETTSPTLKIKANIWKFMNLWQVKTKAAIIIPTKLDGKGGEALQSFSRLSAQCCTQEFCKMAKNIRKFGIRGDLALISDADCFKELIHLEKMTLVYDVFPEEAPEKPLRGLPNPDRFPPNLRVLHLSGTRLRWSSIRPLENLPRLEVLKLKNNAFEENHWVTVHGRFPFLKILVIVDNKVKVWTASKTCFPNLECLVLKDCKELEEIPFQLTENLRLLHVERVSESAVVSARKIDAEKQRARRNQNGKKGEFQLIIVTGAR